MIRQSRHIVAGFFFLLWAFIQTADFVHHVHEEVEEHCEIGETHLCEEHHTAELCDLCTLVHGEAEFNLGDFSTASPYRCVSLFCLVNNSGAQDCFLQPNGRAPPHVV